MVETDGLDFTVVGAGVNQALGPQVAFVVLVPAGGNWLVGDRVPSVGPIVAAVLETSAEENAIVIFVCLDRCPPVVFHVGGAVL